MAEVFDDGTTLLTYDEAVALLPEGDQVHTFVNPAGMLIGADWDRADILALLERTDQREVTGEQAQAFGHGLAAWDEGRPIFIEARQWQAEPVTTDPEAGE